MGLSKLWEIMKDQEACHSAIHGVAKSQTWLNDWTKNKSFYTVKETINKMKRPSTKWEKMFANDMSNKGWMDLEGITSSEIRQSKTNTWRRQWHSTPVHLPGKSHGWRSLVGYSPWGRTESDTTERLHFHFSFSCTEEGNGNPLQCSCLENPRDRGAWWLPAMGSHRVGHDWSNLAAAAARQIPYDIYHLYVESMKQLNKHNKKTGL